MPAKDRYHDKVVQALINNGWAIIKEQVAFRVGIRRLWIDVEAVRTDTSPILVEVKMFERPSDVNALASAVGQYLLYRAALRYLGIIDKILFMAVPDVAY